MLYEVEADGRKLTVEISKSKGSLSIRGREVRCDWVKLPDGRLSLILDGCVFDLGVEKTEESWQVTGRRGSCSVRVFDPRHTRLTRSSEDKPAGVQSIRAEMPGRVIRVLVRPGESVAVDQGLLVIEAMKMQNEIRAPRAGTIIAVAAREEMTVSSGEFLLSIG